MGGIHLAGEWKIAAKIGFTYIGTVVGAGFATGQEILQFFTTKGPLSFIGVVIAAFAFVWLGNRTMLVGARLKAVSYEAFNEYLFGKRVGHVMNIFVTIELFGVTTAMVSGTGALAEEQMGVPFHVGVLLTLGLAYFVILRGLDGIFSVNSLVVPMMVLFCLLIGGSGVIHPFDALLASTEKTNFSWLLSALAYVSFNLAMAQAVLVPMGGEIRDERVIKKGGLMGGIGLGLMLLATNFALTLEGANVSGLEIPLAPVIAKLGFFVKTLFIVVMWAEIFTTLIGNAYGLITNLGTLFPIGQKKLLLLMFVLSYALSLIGFSNLVGYVYPLFGYCGLATMVLLTVRKIPPMR